MVAVAQQKRKWKQLFNGKNLDGWTVKIKGHELNENFGNTFRVVDGKMIVSYDQYDSFREQYGHIFYKKPYSYYLLAVEYRFVGQQAKGGEGWAYKNSGIMLNREIKSLTSLHPSLYMLPEGWLIFLIWVWKK